MNKRRFTKLIIGVAGLLVVCVGVGLIAFLLVPSDKNNPSAVREPNWNSPQTRVLAERACFDCHSNETKWPWYSYIPPVSGAIAHEVTEGRAALNFSEWPSGETDELIEVILEGQMPPNQYLLLHPEARLTDAETKTLIDGLQATFGNSIGETSETEAGEEIEHKNGDKVQSDDDEYEREDHD